MISQAGSFEKSAKKTLRNGEDSEICCVAVFLFYRKHFFVLTCKNELDSL